MVTEGLQLSPQQKHLWAVTRDDEAGVYQARCEVRLHGELDKSVLGKAIDDVVKRHEILRTAFRIPPGLTMPVQVIDEISPAVSMDIDLTSLSRERQDLELESLFQRLVQKPFASQSPLRTTLVRLGETEHALLLNLSAACADSITLDNLVHEISKNYEAHLRGNKLSDALLQYADISEVLNELLESEETETGRGYWQQHDLSSLQLLRLPFEREITTNRRFEPAFVPAQLGTDVLTQLDALIQPFGVSHSVVLLTCWQVLLGRLIGQADLVVGASCDGRSYEGLPETLGLLARYLPIRCHSEENQTFADLLKQVNGTIAEVQEWQDYFLLGGNGSNGAGPAYLPYCFEFENPNPTYVAGNLAFTVAKRHACFDRFKLKLRCTRGDSAVQTELHFDRSLFPTIDVEVLLDQFQVLLQSALANPHRSVSKLEFLGTRERERILIDFNRTETHYREVTSIQQLFEEQVARTPDAVAVTGEEKQYTYEVLNAKANQLAHHLRELGAGPEERVGLYLDRSAEMMIGVLGILKSGAAYVPLDPASPRERLAFIVEQARISILVTQAALATSISDKQLRTICLDSDNEALANAATDDPPHVAVPQNTAYIIYTSGSTGRPKGVMVEQRSAINLFFALRDMAYRSIDKALNVGLNAPLIFDASVKQWLQLLAGHHLYIVPDEVRADPAKFLSFIERHKLSVVDCTPTQLKSLASGLAAKSPAMILLGGEAIDESTWRLLAASKETAYFNVYGPTECTVDTTVCDIRESPEQPSIGRPIPNAQVYLLDEKLKPVPTAVAGEIYIGGVGLARGYLDQPALTAEAFIPNPFSKDGGQRLYQTGDIARYLPDGRIKYLGRKDSQLKLNGFRVELKEIEAVIIEHAAVRDAVVVAKQNEARTALIAYLVPCDRELKSEDGKQVLKTEIRSFLREKLPEYMIPGAYVWLPALPLTVNGKLDHKKLPDPLKDSSTFQIKYEAPCNQVERTIASIWQEELRLEKVGIHDNFFDLGGSSLIMVRVFDRLQTTFGNRLKMVELFTHPTIATLAKHLSQDQPAGFPQDRVTNQVNRQKEARSRQRQTKAQVRSAGNNGFNN